MGESRQEREDLMSYVDSVLETVIARNPGEPEFHQATQEVLQSLELVVEKRPEIEKSGLLERYNEGGLPVIYLLNIKRLAAAYGLPYDPQELSPIGESAVYYETAYRWPLALVGAAAAVGLLLWGRHCRRREEET